MVLIERLTPPINIYLYIAIYTPTSPRYAAHRTTHALAARTHDTLYAALVYNVYAYNNSNGALHWYHMLRMLTFALAAYCSTSKQPHLSSIQPYKMVPFSPLVLPACSLAEQTNRCLHKQIHKVDYTSTPSTPHSPFISPSLRRVMLAQHMGKNLHGS